MVVAVAAPARHFEQQKRCLDHLEAAPVDAVPLDDLDARRPHRRAQLVHRAVARLAVDVDVEIVVRMVEQPQQPLELIPLRVGDDQIRMPHVGLLPNETRPQSTVLRAMAHRAQIALLG